MTKYNPMDIANYLIWLAKDKGKDITNLKLQKIFVNAKYLVDSKGAPLMDQKFERWAYGPVMYSVYSNFRSFGSQPITEPAGTYVYGSDNPLEAQFKKFDPNKIEDKVKKIAGDVFDALIDKNPFDLVDYTHSETIWSKYRDEIQKRGAPDYENEELYKYFKSDSKARIWEP